MISREKILEFETRRNIYRLILEKPGYHERKISRELDIPRSTLKYHLNFFEKRELLVIEKTNRYNSYFIRGKIGRKDKKIISLFQKETYRSIVMFMLFRVNTTVSEISKEIERHPNTINSHVKKLKDMNIIEPVPIEGNEIKKISSPVIIEYSPKTNENLIRLSDPDRIYSLALTYKGQLKEKFILDIISEALDYYSKYGFPEKKRRVSLSEIDYILEKFYEVFPIPWRA